MRRWPPPRCRTVILPVTLRPECFLSETVRPRFGLTLTTSAKELTLMNRRPEEAGRDRFSGTSHPLEEVGDGLAGLQGDHCLLPIAAPADDSAPATHSGAGHSLNRHHVDRDSSDLECGLDRRFDLQFVGIAGNPKDVALMGHAGVRLLTDHRSDQHQRGVPHPRCSPTASTAALVNTRVSAASTSRTLRLLAKTTFSWGMFLADSSTFSERSASTRSTRRPASTLSRKVASLAVRGCSYSSCLTTWIAPSEARAASAERRARRRCLRGI